MTSEDMRPRNWPDWVRSRMAVFVMFAAALTAWGTVTGYAQSGWASLVGRGVAPHLEDLSASLIEVRDRQAQTLERIEALDQRLEAIEDAYAAQTAPVLEFARSGHSISDANIGSFALMTWAFFRLVDACGAPQVSVFFRDARGVVHRFEDLSIADRNSIGRAVEARPNVMQDIRYTARVSATGGVVAGPAFGWVELFYPACPRVPTAISPEVQFDILDPLRQDGAP